MRFRAAYDRALHDGHDIDPTLIYFAVTGAVAQAGSASTTLLVGGTGKPRQATSRGRRALDFWRQGTQESRSRKLSSAS